MIVICLTLLIEIMAASEVGCSYDLDIPWPLHRSLVRLSEDSAAVNQVVRWSVPVGLVADAGTGVPGLDSTIHDLLRRGALIQDPARARRLVLAQERQYSARRAMLRLEVWEARLLYRAARMWATASSTVSKNLDTAVWSVAPTYSTSPPNRRQVLVPVR
jgi:hypothetical protein